MPRKVKVESGLHSVSWGRGCWSLFQLSRVKAGYTLSKSLVYNRADIERHANTLTIIPMDNLKLPVHLICMTWESWSQSTNLIHSSKLFVFLTWKQQLFFSCIHNNICLYSGTGTGRSHRAGNESGSFLLRGNSVSHNTTVRPHLQIYSLETEENALHYFSWEISNVPLALQL